MTFTGMKVQWTRIQYITSDKTENDWEPNKAQGVDSLSDIERVVGGHLMKLQQIFQFLRLN